MRGLSGTTAITARQRAGFGWRREWPTWALLVLVYGGWIWLTAAYDGNPVWITLPVLAVLTALHGSLQHELLHGHPSRWQGLNDVMAWPPLAIWLPYLVYRDSHLAHHRDDNLTDPYDDPESYYLDRDRYARLGPAARMVLKANNSLAGRLLIGPPLQTAVAWIAGARAVAAGDRRQLGIWASHLLGLALLALWLSFVGMPIWVYVLFVAYPGIALVLIRSFAEHRAVANIDQRTAIVEAGWFFRLLFLNNNFHVTHHARPELPWPEVSQSYWANREQILVVNGGYVMAGYGDLFRRYLMRPKEPVAYPLRCRRSGIGR